MIDLKVSSEADNKFDLKMDDEKIDDDDVADDDNDEERLCL